MGATMKLSFARYWSFARICVVLLAVWMVMRREVCLADDSDSSWIFRRSYFSHIYPPEVQMRYPIPVSRSAYRLPLVNTTPNFGVRSTYRLDTINIRGDMTLYEQFSTQVEP
jgi:hypothetical protein